MDNRLRRLDFLAWVWRGYQSWYFWVGSCKKGIDVSLLGDLFRTICLDKFWREKISWTIQKPYWSPSFHSSWSDPRRQLKYICNPRSWQSKHCNWHFKTLSFRGCRSSARFQSDYFHGIPRQTWSDAGATVLESPSVHRRIGWDE